MNRKDEWGACGTGKQGTALAGLREGVSRKERLGEGEMTRGRES